MIKQSEVGETTSGRGIKGGRVNGSVVIGEVLCVLVSFAIPLIFIKDVTVLYFGCFLDYSLQNRRVNKGSAVSLNKTIDRAIA